MDKNVKIDLKEWYRESVDWIQLAQDVILCRDLMNVIVNLQFPWNAGNFLTSSVRRSVRLKI
jgi:hypothetical protein